MEINTGSKSDKKHTLIKAIAITALALLVLVNIVGATPYAYITNDNDTHGTVTVIDTATDACIKTVDVGTAPLGVAVNPAGTKAYVVNWGIGTVSVIDTATNTVMWDMDLGELQLTQMEQRHMLQIRAITLSP